MNHKESFHKQAITIINFKISRKYQFAQALSLRILGGETFLKNSYNLNNEE